MPHMTSDERRGGERTKGATPTIVVAADGSPGAATVLERAAELATALAARLLVVCIGPTDVTSTLQTGTSIGMPVVPSSLGGGLLDPGSGATGEPLVVASLEAGEEQAARRLDEARRGLVDHPGPVELVARAGDVAEELIVAAEESGATMIVVGHGEHGFLERLLARPVEDAVARRARCDVHLVHL